MLFRTAPGITQELKYLLNKRIIQAIQAQVFNLTPLEHIVSDISIEGFTHIS